MSTSKLRRCISVATWAVVLPVLMAGCEQTPPQAPPQTAAPTPAPPPLPPILPFEQAIDNAANAVLSAQTGTPRAIVIDPLVDGVTGDQSAATRRIGARISTLIAERYPNYRLQPFGQGAVSEQPLVMVGTFTAVNATNQTSGERVAYRFCLVMADLRSGRTVAKSVARAQLAGVDSNPAAFFQQSPVWSEDPAIRSYVNTCQGTRVGDAIPAEYLRGIEAAAIVQEAMSLYEAGRLQPALARFEAARATSAGDQLRVHNGLYLVKQRMGRQAEATAQFGQLVDYGLEHQRLAVKLLFQPGTTNFVAGATASQYPMWLSQIASRAEQRPTCLEIRGHTSTTGPADVNERLSTQRAQAVEQRLVALAPPLASRIAATGVGPREVMVGTGRDDASDVLDRRVEFRIKPKCS
ncbi:MAG TPA: OmpA family protein [Vineibacter sp.]|nr:OmpA family protein [Vineibacter sp.]